MALFTIWKNKEGGITLKRGAEKTTHPMDVDAVLVKEFQASSWNEACQVEYDHYGWGQYKSHNDWPEIGPDED